MKSENKYKCPDCIYYLENKVLPLNEQYSLKRCEKASKMKRKIDKLKLLKDEYKEFMLQEYSKIIFDIFKEQRPRVCVHKYKDVFDWNEVFPENYYALNDESKIALINLVEGIEGEYSLTKNRYYKR